MGNCINPHAVTWLDDEERESEAEEEEERWLDDEERESEAEEEEERVSSAQSLGDQSREQKTLTATSKERIMLKDQVTIRVTIRMSKRQLEEVLRQADLRGAAVEQVLPDVMSQQREREALESIPEAPE